MVDSGYQAGLTSSSPGLETGLETGSTSFPVFSAYCDDSRTKSVREENNKFTLQTTIGNR